jgi:hypothetical protein
MPPSLRLRFSLRYGPKPPVATLVGVRQRTVLLALVAIGVLGAAAAVAAVLRDGEERPRAGVPPAPTQAPPPEPAPPVPPPAPPVITEPCPPQGEPVAPADALSTFDALARQVVRAARRTAADGTPVYLPDGVARYTAVWVRDFAAMAEAGPGLVPDADLEAGIRWLLARQRPEDGAMPDRVGLDGAASYHVLGDRPPTDNPAFMVALVAEQHRRTGSTALFGEVAPALGRGLASVPRDDSGLVVVDPAQPHSSYGFTDSVAKTGRELFTSLLFAQAAGRMGDLYAAAGDAAQAEAWRAEAGKVRGALGALYDEPSGMFLAASDDGRVIDVWGSAFAVAAGLVDDARADRIATWLDAHLGEIAWRGQIRHLPAGQRWPRMLDPQLAGTYQDGGHWATATGWVAEALARVDRPRAQRLLAEAARAVQGSDAREFVTPGPESCRLGTAQYATSAVLPLLAARRLLR